MDYIIYHKNCIDGFTGLLLLSKICVNKSTIIYPDIPSTKYIPPNIKDKNIIIVDVSYSKEILENIFKLAKKVIYIDHHVTSEKYASELGKKYNHIVYYDKEYCGASLVWKIFYKNKKQPKLIKHVEDNDIGKWIYKDTKPIISYIQTNYTFEPSKENIKKWSKLLDDKYLKKVIKIGEYYEEYKLNLVKQFSHRITIKNFISEKLKKEFPEIKKYEKYKYKVAVINGACPNVTALGEYIAKKYEKECDFVFLWSYNIEKKEYIISLRSKNTNIEKLAKIFGGGGHEKAAAFSMKKEKLIIDDFFSN